MSNNKNLSFGLNARNKRKKPLTGFGGDDSDDSNSDSAAKPKTTSARGTINREIAQEQAALRKRAKAAMAASSHDSAVYDYDAEYDSFSSGKKKEEAAKSAAAAAASKKQNEPKAKVQPRYITSLLKTAQRRNQEHEVIHERQVQKEQAAEDADQQFEGKDKFITSSYKRKLAEREQWAIEEKDRAKLEEEEDVTKKTGVGSFMFGGIGRSMLMGSGVGGGDNKNEAKGDRKSHEKEADVHDNINERSTGNHNNRNYNDHQQQQPHRDSSRETERRWGSSKRNHDSQNDDISNRKQPPPIVDEKELSKEVKKTRQQILEERAIKIREARERYFKRTRGIVSQ